MERAKGSMFGLAFLEGLGGSRFGYIGQTKVREVRGSTQRYYYQIESDFP